MRRRSRNSAAPLSCLQRPNQLEALTKDGRIGFQPAAKALKDAVEVPGVSLAPIAQASISFSLEGGEVRVDGLEGN
jgi:hypothetical protein